VLRIVANEARNRRKAAQRRLNLARRSTEMEATAEPHPSPEASTLAAERDAQVRTALTSLREEDRLALAYRYFLDLSEAEMAGLLGVARGTVKSRLSRALGRLRERLPRGWEADQEPAAEPRSAIDG
jgi:RNA polymerase sigma-70 factor (ECF subfamily)